MTDKPNVEKNPDFLIKHHMIYHFNNSLIKYNIKQK